MADVVFLAVALAFFALCVLYVLGCDKLIGREPATASEPYDARTEAGVTLR